VTQECLFFKLSQNLSFSHWKGMSVVALPQNYIILLLACFSTLLK